MDFEVFSDLFSLVVFSQQAPPEPLALNVLHVVVLSPFRGRNRVVVERTPAADSRFQHLVRLS
jgi:hypothetical protein